MKRKPVNYDRRRVRRFVRSDKRGYLESCQ